MEAVINLERIESIQFNLLRPTNELLFVVTEEVITFHVERSTVAVYEQGASATVFAVASTLDATFTHNLGRIANATFVEALGLSAGVSLFHTPNTVRLRSNLLVSGTLVCV